MGKNRVRNEKEIFSLKPCPFCGGMAKLHYNGVRGNDLYFFVKCENCRASSRTVRRPYGDFDNLIGTNKEFSNKAAIFAKVSWNARHNME